MEIRELFGQYPGTIGVVGLIALLLGILYALLIDKVGDAIGGYRAIAVVGGVVMTLALCLFLLPITHVLLVMFVFVCTGLPMIVGEIVRHILEERAKSEELAAILKDHTNGYTS